MHLPKPVQTLITPVRDWTNFRNLEIGLAVFCFLSPIAMILADSCRYTAMDPACMTSDGKFEQGIRAAISHYWDMPAAVAFYVPLTVAVMMFLVRATVRSSYRYNWWLGGGLLLLVVFNHEHGFFPVLHYTGVAIFFITNIVVLLMAITSKTMKVGVLAVAVAGFFAGNLFDSNWGGNWLLWAEWASLLVIAAHFILIAIEKIEYRDAPVAPKSRRAAAEGR
ncbi:MAG TPA: hypothetical protein VK960_07920 [Acidimicrobiia bacterium]|nr:hypothetical protein [Acidimicrobiia bacterium]